MTERLDLEAVKAAIVAWQEAVVASSDYQDDHGHSDGWLHGRKIAARDALLDLFDAKGLALISEVEALREALKPVAEFSAVFDRHVLGLSGREHESIPVATVHKWGGENQDVRIPVAHLYIGDLRRARAVLPETETEEK